MTYYIYSGRTPLHVAALEGRAGVAAVLVEGGAPVEAEMYAGPFRPLHLAAQGGRRRRGHDST